MKKSIIALSSVMLAFAFTSQAQESENDQRSNLKFGVRAGINYANVWDERGQDFRADPRVGIVGGAFLGIPIGEIMGIQPEILLSQKGFKGSGTLLGSTYSFF